MRTYITMFRNVELECFTTPQFIDIEPEKAAEQLARSIKMAAKDNPKQLLNYRHLKLCYFGEFDDTTGKMDLLETPEEILDCAALVKATGIFEEKKDA